MNFLLRIARELAYNSWANRETMTSLLRATNAPQRAVQVMGHIVGAEWIWLSRLGYPSETVGVWPELSLVESEKQLRLLAPAWRLFLDGLSHESLYRELEYKTTRGELCRDTAADILTHVVLHSSYHRGQIALLLGHAGEIAAVSDYIVCVRNGYLEDDSTVFESEG